MGIGWLKGTSRGRFKRAPAISTHGTEFSSTTTAAHSVVLPLTKYSVDGSSGEGSWALLECLAQDRGSDKNSQQGAGQGYEGEDEEEDKEEDEVNDAEAVERLKGESGAERKRVVLGEGLTSTSRSTVVLKQEHPKRAPNGPVDLCSTKARGEDFFCATPNRSSEDRPGVEAIHRYGGGR